MHTQTRGHRFTPANKHQPITGPCTDDGCGMGYLAPQHHDHQAGARSVFDALDRHDALTAVAPQRLALAEQVLRDRLAEVANLGATAGRLDRATWAAWTHAALDRALAAITGEITDPDRLRFVGILPTVPRQVPAPPDVVDVDQQALVV